MGALKGDDKMLIKIIVFLILFFFIKKIIIKLSVKKIQKILKL